MVPSGLNYLALLKYAIKAPLQYTCNLLICHRRACNCALALRKPALQAFSTDMLGSLPVSGASIYCQQVDGLSLDCTTSASVAALDTPPASPRLFGSTALPQTPPSQLLRAASSPPPMRRLQKFASPPPASHPILSSAITVACTADPDACHSQGRLPTQRQLAFSFQNTPPAQQTSPFATAAAIPEPPSLLDKINRLPGPQHVLRTVRKETKDSLSLQDSGMLTHMLHRASRFHTENDGCAGGSSSAGSGCRYCKSNAWMRMLLIGMHLLCTVATTVAWSALCSNHL